MEIKTHTYQKHPVRGYLTEQEYAAMLRAPMGAASHYQKINQRRAKEAANPKRKSS